MNERRLTAVRKAQQAARRRELAGLTREPVAMEASPALAEPAAREGEAPPEPRPEVALRAPARTEPRPPGADAAALNVPRSLAPEPNADPAAASAVRDQQYQQACAQLREAEEFSAPEEPVAGATHSFARLVTARSGAGDIARAAHLSMEAGAGGSAGEGRIVSALQGLHHTVERNHREALDHRPHQL